MLWNKCTLCNLILALAVPCNVIHPWCSVTWCSKMGPGWIFWSINITSVPVFCLLLSPPSLVAKSHSFLQFLGGNQHAARVPPIIFHPCLVCAAQKRFLHSRENSFLHLRGQLGAAPPIWYSAYSQRNGPWPVAVAVLVALTTIYDTRRHTSSAEDRIPLLSTNIFMISTNTFMPSTNKSNLRYVAADVFCWWGHIRTEYSYTVKIFVCYQQIILRHLNLLWTHRDRYMAQATFDNKENQD